MTDTGSEGALAIVLVEPQIGENIGAVARAMLNFGVTDLRLVRPKQAWPNPRAQATASGADIVLEKARLFDTTEDAVGDLHRLYATTARHRELLKPVAAPRHAAAEMRRFVSAGEKVGVMFGAERTGLLNEDVVLAHTLITIPTNRAFFSLNLGQAALLVLYEFGMTAEGVPLGEHFDMGGNRPANRFELFGLFHQLEAELDESGFFDNIPTKRDSIVQNIRNSFQRGALLEQDVRTLRGVIKAIAGKRIPGSRRKTPLKD